MMNNPVKFIEEVKNFDKNNIDDWKLQKVKEFTSKPEFTFAKMEPISSAAANLCKWALACLDYNVIYKRVKPLMDKASEAEGDVRTAEAKLKIVKVEVAVINAKVANLQG